MARARKPSPPLKKDRAGNRQRPPARQTSRRKLAISDAKRLARTIQGVELASNPDFLAKVRQHAATTAAKKTGPENWFVKFQQVSPNLAAELHQAAIDWCNRGETFMQFCGLRTTFHAFVTSTYTAVGYQAFCRWLDTVEAAQ
jgi:hypothetical protein